MLGATELKASAVSVNLHRKIQPAGTGRHRAERTVRMRASKEREVAEDTPPPGKRKIGEYQTVTVRVV